MAAPRPALVSVLAAMLLRSTLLSALDAALTGPLLLTRSLTLLLPMPSVWLLTSLPSASGAPIGRVVLLVARSISLFSTALLPIAAGLPTTASLPVATFLPIVALLLAVPPRLPVAAVVPAAAVALCPNVALPSLLLRALAIVLAVVASAPVVTAVPPSLVVLFASVRRIGPVVVPGHRGRTYHGRAENRPNRSGRSPGLGGGNRASAGRSRIGVDRRRSFEPA